MINFANDSIEVKKLRKTMKALLEKTDSDSKLDKALHLCCREIIDDRCKYYINVSRKYIEVKLITGGIRYILKEDRGIEDNDKEGSTAD